MDHVYILTQLCPSSVFLCFMNTIGYMMTMKFFVCGHYYVCDMTEIVIVATRKSTHDPLLCEFLSLKNAYSCRSKMHHMTSFITDSSL